MDEHNVVVKLENVSKTYYTREEEVRSIREYLWNMLRPKKKRKIEALKNIDLEVIQGETFGIIGRNGSGKSTLLNIIMGSIKADPGASIKKHGKMIRLALGMGVDKNLSARDNIYVNASILGLSFKKIGMIFNDIVEYAGLEEFVDIPVKKYSKGMHQRLLFSIAMHAEADIFLLDEFFGGVGDEDFKKKSDESFRKRIVEGKTIIMVSHSLNKIVKTCNRAMWLHKGEIVAIGDPKEVVTEYRASFAAEKEKPNSK